MNDKPTPPRPLAKALTDRAVLIGVVLVLAALALTAVLRVPSPAPFYDTISSGGTESSAP